MANIRLHFSDSLPFASVSRRVFMRSYSVHMKGNSEITAGGQLSVVFRALPSFTDRSRLHMLLLKDIEFLLICYVLERCYFYQTLTNALASHRRIVEKLFAPILLEVTSVSASLGTSSTIL